MSVYHDEVEIEDFEYDEEEGIYYYPCPCGDRFEVTKVRKIYFPGFKGYILMNEIVFLGNVGGTDRR